MPPWAAYPDDLVDQWQSSFDEMNRIVNDGFNDMSGASGAAYDSMTAHVNDYYEKIEAQNKRVVEGVRYFADQGANAIAEFAVSGKFSFKDFANSVIQDLIRIQARTLLTSIFSKIAGASDIGADVFASASANAKGGVYDAGGQVAFARGGIVSEPTVFPFANGIGLMGEAGPEAILPLQRTRSGDLGVKSVDGGQKTVIENLTVVNLATLDTETTYQALKRSGAVEGLAIESLNHNGALRRAILENL